MKRILFLSGRDVTAYGAMGRAHHLLRRLSAQYEVVVFNTRHYWKWKTRLSSDDYKPFVSQVKEITNGYPIRSSDAYVSEALNVIPNFAKVHRLLNKGRFDLIINHNYLFFEPVRLTRRVRQPVIFEVVDYTPDMVGGPEHSCLPLSALASRVVKYLMDASIRASDLVIVCTMLLRDYAQRTRAKEIRVLSNGVDLDMDALSHLHREEKRRECGFEPGDIVLGSIGSIYGPTRFSTAMRAVQHFKKMGRPIKLLIGGDGVGLSAAKEEAAQLDIKDRVTFLGRVTYAERFDYMAAMDICLLPYEISPLTRVLRPLKLFEYLACGKSVLSTPIPEVQRLFPEAEYSQIVYANDVDAFVARAEALLDRLHTLSVQNAIEKARDLVFKHYTWDAILDEYMQIVASMIGA